MNLSNLQHALIAIALQFVIWISTGSPLAGALAGAFFFIGREWTQAEYRWIDANGGRRAAMPWYAPLRKDMWHVDSLLDFIVPGITVFLVWYVFG